MDLTVIGHALNRSSPYVMIQWCVFVLVVLNFCVFLFYVRELSLKLFVRKKLWALCDIVTRQLSQ